MSEHAEQLAKYLREVLGGHEVLEARDRELYPDPDTEFSVGDEARIIVRGPVAIRRGNDRLPESFWELPRPEDPEGSVRRALDEERR